MKPFFNYSTLIFTTTAITVLAVLNTADAVQWQASVPADKLPTQANQQLSVNAAPAKFAVSSHHYRDGSFTGRVFDAYYGQVQVKANVHSGRLNSIDVLQFPSDRRTSRAINSQALPMLESEVIRAQSTQVDTVSGATLTSKAYLRSLDTALGLAGF